MIKPNSTTSMTSSESRETIVKIALVNSLLVAVCTYLGQHLISGCSFSSFTIIGGISSAVFFMAIFYVHFKRLDAYLKSYGTKTHKKCYYHELFLFNSIHMIVFMIVSYGLFNGLPVCIEYGISLAASVCLQFYIMRAKLFM